VRPKSLLYRQNQGIDEAYPSCNDLAREPQLVLYPDLNLVIAHFPSAASEYMMHRPLGILTSLYKIVAC
jgi:hypothetical protein